MAQWTLTDSSTGSPVVFTFTINPVAADHPGRKSTITSETSTGPNGQVIMFQGKDKVQRMKIEGAVLTQVFFQALTAESEKFYPMVLTDDEGRTHTVIFEAINWKRIKRRNPWRYDYTITFVVLP